ncbi:MAG: DUF4922 domain-containing protein [Clostridium sp.]|nr:DUF4922 domain-containing protein [Prevotella sp.]MCM1428244.1 DUF4922 domain-containing protein [Clostridium sp.]MCM1474728.1 DUF4922 domain-containing protein [Muribaculaceae bacterium]
MELQDFVESQLQHWDLAQANYLGLGATDRRRFQLGDFPCFVQYNPARIKSTGAKVDATSIDSRPCFLCKENRPKEQITEMAYEGWELLVNPYPIFPLHFTIPFIKHEPQDEIPLEMASIAERWPGMAVFFNGARAGASAPDHAHMQMVAASELPLLAVTEKWHPVSAPGIKHSSSFGGDFPFEWWSAVITPDLEGMKSLAELPTLYGFDPETGLRDRGLVNAFFWIDTKSALLRAIVVPRRRHRPACFAEDASRRLLVSPGAIDMAGVVVCPRKEDFESITEEDLRKIYAEV